MKKFIFVLSIIACAFGVNAQSTSPRFGTSAGMDNTGRVLTYAYKTVTDASGADSTTLNPNAWKTIVQVALTDSVYFKSPIVTRSYAGDQLVIVASSSTSGKKVKFAGTNFISTGTATTSTGLRAVIQFIFDGAKWVETCRTVQ
jgi:hypothetical protein